MRHEESNIRFGNMSISSKRFRERLIATIAAVALLVVACIFPFVAKVAVMAFPPICAFAYIVVARNWNSIPYGYRWNAIVDMVVALALNVYGWFKVHPDLTNPAEVGFALAALMVFAVACRLLYPKMSGVYEQWRHSVKITK